MSIAETIAELRRMREHLCMLSRFQEQLRSALRQDIERSQKTPTAYAHSLGISHLDIRRCLVEGKAICGRRVLRALASRLPAIDFDTLIRHVDGLKDRYRGLIACSPEAIAAAFDLKEAYATVASKGNTIPFCELFGQYRELVGKILNDNADAVARLDDPPVRDAIRSCLSPDWRERFSAARSQQAGNRKELSRVFVALDRQLRPRFQNMDQYARALGVSPSTCRTAIRGESSSTQLAKLIERSRRLLAEETETRPPIASAQPIAGVAPSLAEVLARHGGGTSERGVPFILSAESFEEIEGDPGEAFVALTQRQLQLVRGLLNVAAQLKDEAVRARIRTILTPEVEELYATIGLFTFANPSKLTDIYDAQRRTFQNAKQAPNAPRRKR